MTLLYIFGAQSDFWGGDRQCPSARMTKVFYRLGRHSKEGTPNPLNPGWISERGLKPMSEEKGRCQCVSTQLRQREMGRPRSP